MARPDAERTANEESEEVSPGVGTDPARTPQDEEADDGGHHRVVSLDEDKVEEHERRREEQREHETPEERAERIKDA